MPSSFTSEARSVIPGIDIAELASQKPDATGRSFTVAFDLDETLLLNSWTGSDSWSEMVEHQLFKAWRRGSRESLISRLRNSRLGRAGMPLIRRTPFLGVCDRPVVEVAFRSHAIELLHSLHSAGVELVLITASAKPRLEYLFRRMPWFQNFFERPDGSTSVICGEQIDAGVRRLKQDLASSITKRQADQLDESTKNACLKLHKSEPPSLGLKTPLLTQRVLQNEIGFHVLIDDHPETERAFQTFGLGQHLIKIDGSLPYSSDVMKEVWQKLKRRISENDPRRSPQDDLKLQRLETQPFRLEDPYYIPLLKKTLVLDQSTDA